MLIEIFSKYLNRGDLFSTSGVAPNCLRHLRVYNRYPSISAESVSAGKQQLISATRILRRREQNQADSFQTCRSLNSKRGIFITD